jgi:diphosphomevalonate decarboxylase
MMTSSFVFGAGNLEVSMPSNIALIKYMGKTQVHGNLPTNASMSYTLEKLRTFVLLEESDQDQWSPLVRDDLYPLELSEKGKQRFLSHLQMLKREWKITKNFHVRSANNFESDAGLASSASSFAALTMAVYQWCAQHQGLDLHLQQIADFSRQGSGSSCRSFYSGWVLWDAQGIHHLDFPFKDLGHHCLVLDAGKKEVSSSQAHVRVAESLLFQGRPERAQQRYQDLSASLKNGDWKKSMQIAWAEFWDMHALFETCPEPFGYMNGQSQKALQILRQMWLDEKDGPLITMDAGPNIHLLFRKDQATLQQRWITELKKEISK